MNYPPVAVHLGTSSRPRRKLTLHSLPIATVESARVNKQTLPLERYSLVSHRVRLTSHASLVQAQKMKLHPLALLVILSSVGEYFGYCRPLLTLHSSPSSALLAHAFAQILPHVNEFRIDPLYVWYESDLVGLYIYAGENPGFELYKLKLVQDIQMKECSLIVRKGVGAGFFHFFQPRDNRIVNIYEDELDAVGSLCLDLVGELNFLQNEDEVENLLNNLRVGPGNEARWSISFGQDDQPTDEIDVNIEEGEEPEEKVYMEMYMRSFLNQFKIIFWSDDLPFIQGDDGCIRLVDIPGYFNEVIIQEIRSWLADLQKYME